MTDKQTIKYLCAELKRLNAERKRLRRILNLAANCVSSSSRGHTPNWRSLVSNIEDYEDAYCPLSDP